MKKAQRILKAMEFQYDSLVNAFGESMVDNFDFLGLMSDLNQYVEPEFHNATQQDIDDHNVWLNLYSTEVYEEFQKEIQKMLK